MLNFIYFYTARNPILFVLAMLLMMGCNSTSSNDAQQSIVENANTIGVFHLRHKSIDFYDGFNSRNGAYAIFKRLNKPLSANELLNTYRLPLDTCVVGISDGDVLGISSSEIARYDYSNINAETSINAGDVLNLSSSNGTWLEVLSRRENVGESTYYFYSNANNPIIEPTPNSLELNIPGSDYPTYTDVAIPVVEPLQIQSPQDGIILTLDTSFQWIAATANNTFIRIVASKNVGSSSYSMDCAMEDDGEFMIPESTRVQLSELFKDYSFRMVRSAYTIEQANNSLLLIIHSEGTQ